jgi:hypothetical protein
MLWGSLFVAVLLLWYRDHRRLTRQLAVRYSWDRSSWSIDQLLGQPNTRGFGDISTAWASSSPDGRDEFVIVEFPHSMMAAAVEIYETYNPGAIVRVSAVAANGSETTLWQGADPLRGTPGGGISRIPFSVPQRTRRLKIDIASKSYSGWNEIDAVGLVGHQGQRQWASKSWASSSFGLNRTPPSWYWP